MLNPKAPDPRQGVLAGKLCLPSARKGTDYRKPTIASLIPFILDGKLQRRKGYFLWAWRIAFVNDLRSRIVNRPQITTDAFRPYYGAIEQAFEREVDYAQLIKVFASELNEGRGRYSPPVMLKCEREPTPLRLPYTSRTTI